MNPAHDQDMAVIRDGLPPIWRALYNGCLAQGFTDRQAFALVTAYIVGQNPSGTRPSDVSGPGED